ncbi:MAG TPA: hypothetical protein VGE93_18115, partial [Bryobacteraceae bacterium]
IFFAAAVSHIFGYSLTLLRLTTLALFLCGAIAFYGLLKGFRTDARLAAALTVVLICSPLVLWLAFTFMTDVQFLAWVLIACLFYVTGLRRDSARILFVAGVFAALAIGTRQFGVALPAGLAFAWLTTHPSLRPSSVAVIAGGAVPVATFIWEVLQARAHPTFTQMVRLTEQIMYVHQPPVRLAMQLVWRCSVVAEYAGLLVAAVVPALLLLERRRLVSSAEPSGERSKNAGARAVAVGAFFLVCGHVLMVGASGTSSAPHLTSVLIPTIPWVFGLVMPHSAVCRLLVTGLAVFSGTLVFVALTRRTSPVSDMWRRRTPATCFLAGTVLAFIVMHLAYVQLNDTYTIIFVPFVLIALALTQGNDWQLAPYARVMAVTAASFGIVTALWMRGDYNRQEAIWQGSERIRATGVDTMQIRGSLHWLEYHSAFDRWLEQIGRKARPEDFSGDYRLHDPFYRWVAETQKAAEYIIYPSEQVPQLHGYEIVRRIPYRDMFLRQRFVYVMRRRDEYSRGTHPFSFTGPRA